jgi:hypothetical protein
MAGLTGIEPVLDELKTQLANNLPAKILALQPTFNPVLTMPAPTEYVFGERVNLGLKGMPVVFVDGDATPVTDDNVRWQHYDHEAVIGLAVSDADEENLKRLVQRYTRCVLETLCDVRAAGTFTFGLRFAGSRIEYTPRFPHGDLFVGGSVLPVICHKEENR